MTTFTTQQSTRPSDTGPAGPPRTPQDRWPAPPLARDAGLLLLRLVVGLSMAAHGTQKLFGWFDGPGLSGTEGFFAAEGYPAPGFMALVAGATETFGGLGLALGLLTPLAGAAVLGTMLNALAVNWGSGYLAPEGGMEFVTVLIAVSAALTLTGPGRYAVDSALPILREQRATLNAAAVVLGCAVAGLVLLIRS